MFEIKNSWNKSEKTSRDPAYKTSAEPHKRWLCCVLTLDWHPK